jgi:hypothetical protein
MYRSPGARTVGRPNQPICIRDPATHLPAVHPASPPQQQQQQQHSFRPLPCFVIDGDGICECRSWALATWPTTLSDGQVFHSASDAFFVVQAAKQPSSHAAMQPCNHQPCNSCKLPPRARRPEHPPHPHPPPSLPISPNHAPPGYSTASATQRLPRRVHDCQIARPSLALRCLVPLIAIVRRRFIAPCGWLLAAF